MQWYYAINGQRQGPVTQLEFEKLVREGTIRSETQVWRQGMAAWQPYGEIAAANSPSNATSLATPASAPTASGPLAAQDDSEVCAVSGKRYPRREMIQYEGKWISAEHRDAYFQRIREGVPAAGEYEYAGFWIRFVAKFLDGLLIMAVLFGVGFVAFFFMKMPVDVDDPSAIGTMMALQGLITIAQIGFTLLYSWFFLSRYAATPGKMALGLKVIRPDGQKLSNGRIIGRYFAEMVSGLVLYIGYIMAGFDAQKRSLHDQICDTRVIKTR